MQRGTVRERFRGYAGREFAEKGTIEGEDAGSVGGYRGGHGWLW